MAEEIENALSRLNYWQILYAVLNVVNTCKTKLGYGHRYGNERHASPEEFNLFSMLKASASLPEKSEQSFTLYKMSTTFESSISFSVSGFESTSNKQFPFELMLFSVLDEICPLLLCF
jgi:hypothetical protein